MIQEWDGSAWNIVQTGIEPLADVVRPMLEGGGGEGSGEVRLHDAGKLHLTAILEGAPLARRQFGIHTPPPGSPSGWVGRG